MSEETLAGADEGAELTLHDELAAALDAGGGGGGADEVPAPDAGPSPISEPTPPRAAGEPSASPSGQPPAGEGKTIAPPSSWSATAKAEFAKLPEVIRQEVLKREADIERGKAQWDQKAARLNRLDAVLAPRTERFRLAGIDEAHAVQALLAAQDLLERDPVSGLSYLARQYGVDLRRSAQPPGPGQQPPQGRAQLPPELRRIAEEVQTLKGVFAQQQNAAEHARRSESLTHVQGFAADPSRLYFENVREAMAGLLRAGRASDLDDAYQQATWSDPEIRALFLREQAGQAQLQARGAASAKVADARRASGSVTGSPSPGATPGRTSPTATLRDELEAAFRDHAA